MVNYTKLMEKLKAKDVTTYAIRKYNLFGQEILRKFKMCSGTDAEIEQALKDYKEKNGKDFKADVSTKTIEDICQLLQCQPQDIMDWKVDLKPELSFESIKQKAEEAVVAEN